MSLRTAWILATIVTLPIMPLWWLAKRRYERKRGQR